MKTFLIALIVSFTAFAQNDIKYDHKGLTIEKNNTVFDGARWNLSTEGNRSKFIGKNENKDLVVEVVRNEEGKVIGIGDPGGTKKFYFTDSIIAPNDFEQEGYNVNHRFCDSLDSKLSEIEQCKNKLSSQTSSLRLDDISPEQKGILGNFKSSIIGTNLIQSVAVDLTDTGKKLISLCQELRSYSTKVKNSINLESSKGKVLRQ
jgi:hypothetical protein